MLKPVAKGHVTQHRGFFGWFNRMFDKNSARYQGLVAGALRRSPRVLALYGGIVVVMGFLLWRLPSAFLPDEDQGMLFVQVQMPVGSAKDSTRAVLREVERHFLQDEAKSVESLFTVAGFSFAGNGQNMGMGFVRLKDWDLRPRADMRVEALVGRAMRVFSAIRSGMIFAFAPPAVFELGNATGFDFELQDQGGLGHDKLMAARNQLLGMAGADKNLVRVRPNGLEDTPQYQIDVDKAKAGAFGLSVADVNDLVSSAWGSAYINNFLDKGRVKKVYIQADAPYRMMPEDLNRWYARNSGGDMVPLSAFAKAHWTYGAQRLERYNGLPSLEIQGEPALGKSSGTAMEDMESMAAKLPAGIGYSWTGLSYQERLAGSQTMMLYAVSIIIVFLCLAALYESWTIPFSVILVVPLGVAGAVAAASFRGLANDVYFQVGLLATIGLSAKNAILIVEFAKSLHERGMELTEAVLEAARLRLRPILMTSMAFLLGVAPLAVSNGAGSGSQNDIGTGIMGGTFLATALGIVFVPVFFVLVNRLFKRGGATPPGAA
jgi:multidrug efflux pump